MSTNSDVLSFYSLQMLFLILIIISIYFYIQKMDNVYLLLSFVFFVIQIIVSVCVFKYLENKYKLQIKKNGIPLYILLNNSIILFIILFTGLFIKDKNYLFLILVLIFLILHFSINAVIIGFSSGLSSLFLKF